MNISQCIYLIIAISKLSSSIILKLAKKEAIIDIIIINLNFDVFVIEFILTKLCLNLLIMFTHNPIIKFIYFI